MYDQAVVEFCKLHRGNKIRSVDKIDPFFPEAGKDWP